MNNTFLLTAALAAACQLPVFGQLADPLNNPRDVAIDVDGYFYVADSANQRILKFNSQGERIGDVGHLLGGQPTIMAVDKNNGKVYFTLDTRKDTVFVAVPQGPGTYVAPWPVYITPSGTLISGIAVDTSGNVFVSNGTTNTIMKLSPSDAHPPVATVVASNLNQPAALAVGSNNIVYFVTTSDGKLNKATPQGEGLPYKVEPFGDSSLNQTIRVAADSDNTVYVADASGVIQKFGSDGKVQPTVVAGITGGTGLKGITVASGKVFFTFDNMILDYDPNCTLSNTLPTEIYFSASIAQVTPPSAQMNTIDFDSANNIYLGSGIKLSPYGKQIDTFPILPTGNTRMTVDPNGNVFIGDYSLLSTIWKTTYSPNGYSQLEDWASLGCPILGGLATDLQGNVYGGSRYTGYQNYVTKVSASTKDREEINGVPGHEIQALSVEQQYGQSDARIFTIVRDDSFKQSVYEIQQHGEGAKYIGSSDTVENGANPIVCAVRGGKPGIGGNVYVHYNARNPNGITKYNIDLGQKMTITTMEPVAMGVDGNNDVYYVVGSQLYKAYRTFILIASAGAGASQ